MAQLSTNTSPPTSDTFLRITLKEPYRRRNPHEMANVVFDKRQTRKEIDEVSIIRHDKERTVVGETNRWRFPAIYASDILGKTQLSKSKARQYNHSMLDKITGEHPASNINLDMTQPYKFRQNQDRPYTTPAKPSSNVDTRRTSTTYSTSNKQSKLSIRSSKTPHTVPNQQHSTNPRDILKYHMHKGRTFSGPDVHFTCLGMDWDIHQIYLYKSETLNTLLRETMIPKITASEDTDNVVCMPSSQPKHHPTPRLRINITDDKITPQGLAIALGNMYHSEFEVDGADIIDVLAAAHYLQYQDMQDFCVNLMIHTINFSNVIPFYYAAQTYSKPGVVTECEAWLELNLLPDLSTQIQLKDISIQLLQKIITSPRLFTPNEYSVYKLLSYWLFLQLNPSIQLMPTHGTVLAYFHGDTHDTALLEKPECLQYEPLFSAVRLHGIMDGEHIQDIQCMNILPQRTVIDFLTHHYQSLHYGGDMFNQRNFNDGAIRQGFILNDEPQHHSEVMSVYGFHFMLQAQCISEKTGSYSFSMKRLKPNDSVLSFRQCERQTFSLRADRLAMYSIRVQYTTLNGDREMHETRPAQHRFGLSHEASCSEELQLDGVHSPVYVTFHILFPTS